MKKNVIANRHKFIATFVKNKLITLADRIDLLGLTKHANLIDQINKKAARGEDFGDLMKLWDQPVKLEGDDEELPGQRVMTLPEDDDTQIKDESDMRPEEEARLNRKMEGAGDYLPEDYTHPKYRRLDEIKRRHELMKLKKMLEKMEDGPEEKVEEAPYIEPEEERKQRLRELDEAGLRDDWSQDAVIPSESIPKSVYEDEVLSDEQSSKLEQLEMSQDFEDETDEEQKNDADDDRNLKLKYHLLLKELKSNRNARQDLEDNGENDLYNPEWQELKNDQYKIMLALDEIDPLWRDKEGYWAAEGLEFKPENFLRPENDTNDPEYEDPDNDPFDINLGLLDASDPYQGLSLKKMLKERPSRLPSGPMSDEELEELRIKENKKESLTDRINDFIIWHQQTDGLVEDPRSARKIGEELRLEIEDALEEGIIDDDYAKKLWAGINEKKIINEEENSVDDGLLDALKDAADKAPEALKKVLQLIKDNPELMTLALQLL